MKCRNRKGLTVIDKGKITSEQLSGIYADFANLLGIDAVLKIHNEFRGQQLTMPTRLFSTKYIISQIVESYDGNNIKALATRFGYSEKWVRQILKHHIEKSK